MPLLLSVVLAPIAGFVAGHEGNSAEEEAAHIPGGSPGLLVVVGKGCADGHVEFESAAGSIEVELGGCEGVVFVEFQQAVIESPLVLALQVVDDEMEI